VVYHKLKTHFDTDVNKKQYHTDWTTITFANTRSQKDSVDRKPVEILQSMLDKLQLCQRALGPAYAAETS